MRIKLMAALFVALFAGSAAAQDIVPAHHQLESRPRLFSWLLPSDTGHYIGYHVGGGSNHPHKAEPRREDDGTWGWDYRGCLPRCIVLRWTHGRRYQGGIGAYRTVGTNCESTSTP